MHEMSSIRAIPGTDDETIDAHVLYTAAHPPSPGKGVCSSGNCEYLRCSSL